MEMVRSRGTVIFKAVLVSEHYDADVDSRNCDSQAHFVVDEMLMNGCIMETNKQNILAPIQLLDKAS